MIKRPPIVRRLPVAVKPLPKVLDVKQVALDLAAFATDSVKIVRDAFVVGTPPLQTVGSGSVASFVSGLTKHPVGSKMVRSTSHLGLKTSTAGSSVPPPKPELDSADVVEGPSGVLDQFSVKLVVSIKGEHLDRVKSIRIMRAKLGPVKAPRPAVSAMSWAPSIPGRSSMERNAAAAFRVDRVGIGNKLSSFIFDDPASNTRSVISPDAQELRSPLPPHNNNKGAATMGLLSLDGADRSVLENLQFYLNRRAVSAVEAPSAPPLRIGGRFGVNVLKGNSVASSNDGIVQGPNSSEFSEIGRIDMASPSVRTIGDYLEATFVDKSVVYGAGFVYYVSCVGFDSAEGPRSKLVEVAVVRTIPPEAPTVYYSVVGGHPRFAVRCPQGTDHVEIFRSGRSVDESVRLGTDQSLVVQGPATKIGQFWHLTDVGVGPDGSTTFVDKGAVAGDKLSYRVYSVDSYGMKCQTPFSCSIKMPDHGHNVPIPVPSITVEQAPGQPSVSVKMQVDDPRVAGFFIQRRDVTISEKSVHQANQPEYVDIGYARDAKRAGSRRGPTLLDADWPTYIPAPQGSASFVDTTVKLDRRYQYAVGAVDRRGNRTLLVGAQPVTVYSKTVIDPPTAFAARVVADSEKPTGVLLSWTGGTNDFSPNSIVGDQDVLAATAVRSVFQVERRQLGRPFWDALPATSESYFFDKVSDDPTPPYRPPYVIPGVEYEYRVMAMQSGGFISPRTDVLYVPVVPPPIAPAMIWVKTTPINTNPFSVIVSWNMSSEFVERWEIERAVTNKVFGQQITSMDSKAARDLQYVRVSNMTPEASRGRSLSEGSVDLDRSIYVGNRFYIDGDVHRANSYFYRIRTVGRLGAISPWAYAGVFIKDSAFDKKFFSVMTDETKISLTKDSRPAPVVRDHRDQRTSPAPAPAPSRTVTKIRDHRK